MAGQRRGGGETKIADLEFRPIELVDVEEIAPAVYNPRDVKPERLELVRLSLAKLGWLLPIYVDAEGEILSGHQRHFVATHMLGATRVPVVRTKALNAQMRRTLNLIFNRATNDLKGDQNSEEISAMLLTSDVPAQAQALPDLDVNSEEWYPILGASGHSTVELLDANPVWSDLHGIAMAKRVASMGQVNIMPVVITPSGRVVNGMARLTAAGRAGIPSVQATVIPEEKADIAFGLLNLLSMRYAPEDTFADELRYNAFKAAPHVRHGMSVNSTRDLLGSKAHRWVFERTNPEHARAWRTHYGDTVLDFGAGKIWDARHMAEMGADTSAFEPYYMMDLPLARWTDEEWFFSKIEDPARRYDAIFLSNVMNSVPFDVDREAIVTIVSALSTKETVLHATGRPDTSVTFAAKGRDYLNGQASQAAGFAVDYEPRVQLSNLFTNPMMQKFHSADEFSELWGGGYQRVQTGNDGSHVWVVATKPHPVDPEKLARAIDHEFNLPWKDGKTFGMHHRAREAFERRLGITLPMFEDTDPIDARDEWPDERPAGIPDGFAVRVPGGVQGP